jgi:hypothetical protein
MPVACRLLMPIGNGRAVDPHSRGHLDQSGGGNPRRARDRYKTNGPNPTSSTEYFQTTLDRNNGAFDPLFDEVLVGQKGQPSRWPFLFGPPRRDDGGAADGFVTPGSSAISAIALASGLSVNGVGDNVVASVVKSIRERRSHTQSQSQTEARPTEKASRDTITHRRAKSARRHYYLLAPQARISADLILEGADMLSPPLQRLAHLPANSPMVTRLKTRGARRIRVSPSAPTRAASRCWRRPGQP